MPIVDTTSDRGEDTLDNSAVEIDERLHGDRDVLREFAQELAQLRNRSFDERQGGEQLVTAPGAGGQAAHAAGRVNLDPVAVEQGLAKLVLTLIEFIRRLLERQAMRRMDAGSLTDDEIERMGETFLRLEQRMEDLKAAFGLEGEDLNLSLGPLGNLLPDE